MGISKLKAMIDITILAFISSVQFARAAGDPEVVLQPLRDFLTLVRAGGAIVFVLATTMAGYYFMTAGDNPEKKYSGKAWLSGAVIGAIILVAAPLLGSYFFPAV